MPQEEITPQEKRIRSITYIYYSKPEIQKALLEFSKNREVVPRYMESFGKRPDTLQYPADVMGLVSKGATSFHASEELWSDPLQIQTEMSQSELGELRQRWDLLIDIDSPYLDYSKIAAELVCEILERHGVKSYGIKFSGSKGFHIIVPARAFPEFFMEKETRLMFPEWARAVTEYLTHTVKPEFRRKIQESLGKKELEEFQKKTKLTEEDLIESACPNCGNKSEKSIMYLLKCNRCNNILERPDIKITKRKLRCINPSCPGEYDITEQKNFMRCARCGFNSYQMSNSEKKTTLTKYGKEVSNRYSEFKTEYAIEKAGFFDLVLVSPRHLFRMPYSLHEKTALASLVLSKNELKNFSPKDADPMKVKIVQYYPEAVPGEAASLLEKAIAWKGAISPEPEKEYEHYEEVNLEGVTEDMFPAPIKKLLKGLQEGRKRGLFILITFLRSLNFTPDYINRKVREWNALNAIPLKEGYVRSQIDWHLRQRRKIIPPNYSNDSFYKDLGLIDQKYIEKSKAKNPLVEVIRRLKRQNTDKSL